jgi:hypothetical protein
MSASGLAQQRSQQSSINLAAGVYAEVGPPGSATLYQRRSVPTSRSTPHRLALCATAAMVGLGLALSCVTASAARGSTTPPRSGVAVSEPNPEQPVAGAASRVNLSKLIQDGSQSAPANAGERAPQQNGGEQSSSSDGGGAYTALPPTRILDTRVTGQRLGPNSSLNLTVTGGSVPTDATAVALNVTVTDTTAIAYLAVYPAGGARPVLSNLNWVPYQTIANLVIVPVGVGGQVTFYNDAGGTDVVVDLQGYFAPESPDSTAGSYVPLTPARIADTRMGSGEPYAGESLGPGGSLNIQVAGAGGVPGSGVSAALINVTVTDTTAQSYLVVYPEGATRPLASNLDWFPSTTLANRVVVPVSSTGQITVYNDFGDADVVIDVNGYFTDGTSTPAAASLFSPITPVRVLDTRLTNQELGPGTTLTQEMAGLDGIGSNASAVVANVTATDTTSLSYFTVYPGGVRPLASDVNWSAGQTVPNLTVATLGNTGALDVYNRLGSTELVIDAFGYFVPENPSTLVVATTSLPTAIVGSDYSTTLSAAGGTPPYTWTLTAGSLPGGLSLASTGVISGTPSAAETLDFTVEVTDSTIPTPYSATASLSLSVDLAGAVQQQSSNWSGYVIGNGPYTYVSGSFNVPDLYATPSATYASEWAGIDGFSDSDLIQAGVEEVYDPTTNLVYLQAWWEILPAAETPIAMSVLPGDSVTVAISQVSSTVWSIELTNNTSDQTFETEQTYTGPQSSVEWIVEAPEIGDAISTLGDYTPNVTFSNLTSSGTQNTLVDLDMVQNDVQVSTPSSWTPSEFADAYGAVAPPPP